MNNDTQKPLSEAARELKQLVLSGAMIGETLKELSIRKQLDVALAKHAISNIEARMLMAASDQLIDCIRNGMGLNQALVWMCNAGWPSKISHQTLSRMGV